VTFWGAAQGVTGSMHLIEAGSRRLLLDCGLWRGLDPEIRARNRTFPFDPTSLDAVVLSHAHVDHCGNLPTLVRAGFSGPIVCTPETRELIEWMLLDSARLQREDAATGGVTWGRRDEPLFDDSHVAQTLDQCVELGYDEDREIIPGVKVRLVNAGHILGSAMAAVHVDGRRIAFTGDLGRRDPPLLASASAIPSADLLLCESTNGGRQLESVQDSVVRLEQVVRRALDQNGRVVIPSFSLGRMQVVANCLEQAMRAGRLPAVRIYIDSALGEGIAEVYHRRLGYDWESRVRFVHSPEEGRALALETTPSIVLAPGGMGDGRVVRYLREIIDDPRSAVVLVSYQAPDTLGRRLMTPGPRVRMQGKSFNRWAEIVQLSGFSGHADHDELAALLRGRAKDFGQVCLIHGDVEASAKFAAELDRLGYRNVTTPARGETIEVRA